MVERSLSMREVSGSIPDISILFLLQILFYIFVAFCNRMGLSNADAVARGYTFANNPAIQLFSDLNFKLNLAINTAQYGRTFQDRYIFWAFFCRFCLCVLIQK